MIVAVAISIVSLAAISAVLILGRVAADQVPILDQRALSWSINYSEELIRSRIPAVPGRILDHQALSSDHELRGSHALCSSLLNLQHSMELGRVKALRGAKTGSAGAFGGPDTASLPCSENTMRQGGKMDGEQPLDVTNDRGRVALELSHHMRRARSGELSRDTKQGGPEMIVNPCGEDHIGRPQLVTPYESKAATVGESNSGSLWPSPAGSHWPSLDTYERLFVHPDVWRCLAVAERSPLADRRCVGGVRGGQVEESFLGVRRLFDLLLGRFRVRVDREKLLVRRVDPSLFEHERVDDSRHPIFDRVGIGRGERNRVTLSKARIDRP